MASPQAYKSKPAPRLSTPELQDLANWTQSELDTLYNFFTNFSAVQHNVLYVPPEKPRDGMIVVADGTSWNPGSGAGAYIFLNGLWIYLQVQSPVLTGFMQKSANLSDVANVATSRANLGVAYGKQTLWFPASVMIGQTTGAPDSVVLSVAPSNVFTIFRFDPTTPEATQWGFRMPKQWDEGNISFQVVWSHGAGAVAFGTVWRLDAFAVSDTDSLGFTFVGSANVTDTGGTVDALYHSTESSPFTVGGSPAAGDYVYFRLVRVASDAADTLTLDAWVHGVTVFYTNDTTNDT